MADLKPGLEFISKHSGRTFTIDRVYDNSVAGDNPYRWRMDLPTFKRKIEDGTYRWPNQDEPEPQQEVIEI